MSQKDINKYSNMATHELKRRNSALKEKIKNDLGNAHKTQLMLYKNRMMQKGEYDDLVASMNNKLLSANSRRLSRDRIAILEDLFKTAL